MLAAVCVKFTRGTVQIFRSGFGIRDSAINMQRTSANANADAPSVVGQWGLGSESYSSNGQGGLILRTPLGGEWCETWTADGRSPERTRKADTGNETRRGASHDTARHDAPSEVKCAQDIRALTRNRAEARRSGPWRAPDWGPTSDRAAT
ncbi:hypothetical protein GSI_14100 [Ganoderma sinense ZZ0214-1]|uniref:Uncharacterized protein n=1 Tax=Ganoderma sinense ZZ0214-1 TaxID=1077348 RepID=A0A2G8RS56_9APHY|nr:hypothetical protein GSI_14100 [Ganoderma sinense ZZ0214-1]